MTELSFKYFYEIIAHFKYLKYDMIFINLIEVRGILVKFFY